MSSVYVKEPDYSGKVVLQTTHGPIEIQLWCRECRETTKLFLQLCLDGFYDDMLVHRIVPGFLLQTGLQRARSSDDGSGGIGQTGNNGDLSQYLNEIGAAEAMERRRFELHSRIRFTHRGRVSMALQVDQDDPDHVLQPQFFITLDEAPYLDGKHVAFGSVVGPTIFNAVRIGQHEVTDDTHEPVDLEDAPRIKSVKIVDNPIHTDIAPKANVPWKVVADVPDAKKKKKKKRKGKLDVNVLSFGDEMEEAVVIPTNKPKRSKVSKDIDEPKVKSKSTKSSSETKDSSRAEDNDVSEKPDPKPTITPVFKPVYEKKAAKEAESTTIVDDDKTNVREREKEKTAKKNKKPSMVELQRAKYAAAAAKKTKRKRQNDTMEKLLAFQSKVKVEVTTAKLRAANAVTTGDDSLASRMARRAQLAQPDDDKSNPESDDDDDPLTYRGQVLEDNIADEKSSSWLATRFQCRRHMDHKAGGSDGRSANDYKVLDSRGGVDDSIDNDDDKKHHHSKKRDRKHSREHHHAKKRKHKR